MNDNLRSAIEALEQGAAQVRHLSLESAERLREGLRRTAEEVLDHLEADQRASEGEPEAIENGLDRKAKDIAEDLRRVDRLMRERRDQR